MMKFSYETLISSCEMCISAPQYIDEYVNEWTSRLKLIMTDDYNKFSEVRNSYIKEL